MAKFLDYTGLSHFKDKNDALYAKQDGSYEGMTVGNAEQLVSTVGVSDSAPYTFRTTGGSADVGDRMNLKAVIGGTVAWNQLMDNPTSQSLSTKAFPNKTQIISGHKYFIDYECSIADASLQTSVFLYARQGGSILANAVNLIALNTGKRATIYASTFTAIADGNANSENGIWINISNWSNVTFKSIIVTDLTQMFGSTIADYVYTLESGTAGAGIAWLKKYGYFTKPYYPYKAAALESVKTSAHKTYGFNAYNPSTGKAKVVGGMVYQITGAYTALTLDGTSITPDANGYFTPSANGELTVTGGNSTTTCIHLKWDGERDGEYEPYEEHTYALGNVELRGIPKLDASNNLYYDGDEYAPDGTVTRKYGIVDLGTLSWSYSAASGTQLQRFNTSGIASLVKKEGTIFLGVVCPKYIAVSDPVYSRTVDKAMCVLSSNGMLYIVDSSYTSAADFKTAMNGVYLVYELATPTTETADAYTELQVCDDFGTEEFVDAATRDFDMPCGSLAVYRPNLRAKLEMSPNSPDGDGDYLVRQTNGVNEYVLFSEVKELPNYPTTDGTYVLKCTVADGTATLSWISE